MSNGAGKFAVAATIAGVVFVGGGATAGAADGCGVTQLSFDGVRLLNNGVDHSAGPFSIELEPGTYDITMTSWDAHDEHYQPEQENEQWYFTLDSGYSSPPSIDIPTDQNTSATVLSAQEIDGSSSVMIHHLRAGGVNSVEPVCLGFTALTTEPDDVTPAAETEPATDPVDTEVQGIVEFADPTSQLVPPVSKVNPPIRVEAVQVTQAPAPQLALTGPSMSASSALLGMFLVMIGLACTWISSVTRRRDTTA